MSNKLGFTLIELMMVVAIIGLLAAIAIPTIAISRDKSKLIKAGYSEEEANVIARSNSTVVAEAIVRKKSRSFSPVLEDNWNNGSVTVAMNDHKAFQAISLPFGASSATEGGKWYTFTWAGSKWMALSDGGGKIIHLFIFNGDMPTPMPSLGE